MAAGRRKRFEFSRAALAISAEEARAHPEGERMFQPLISLIGAIVARDGLDGGDSRVVFTAGLARAVGSGRTARERPNVN